MSRPIGSLFVVLLCSLGFDFPILAAEPTVLAVELMESHGSPLKGDEMVGMTDLLSAGLGESGQLQIVPHEGLRARLSGELPEGAGPLASAKVDYLISSSISQVGRRCLLLAEIRDAAKGLTVGAESLERSCAPADLVAGVEALGTRLRADFSLAPGGGRKLQLAAADAPLVRVMLIESRGSPLTVDEVVALSGLLALRIQSKTRWRLFGRGAGMRAGRRDEALVASLRKEVDYTVNASLARIGKLCLVNASLWDVRAGEAVKAASARSKCETDALRKATEQIAERLALAIRSHMDGGSKK